MRICIGCENEKDDSCFAKNRKKCRDCIRTAHQTRKALAELDIGIADTKTCVRCSKEKHATSFYANDTTCRECRLAYNQSKIYNPDNNYFQYRKRLCDGAKYRALTARVTHTITPDDIHIPQFCPALGITLVISNGPVTDNSPSIDRFNPYAGYTPENITVLSWRANTIKNNASPQELRLIADWMDKELSKRKSL